MSIETIITSALSLATANLTDDSVFSELPGWDSMTHMILINDLESAFDVEFTGDEIAGLKTVGDVRRLLQQRGVDL